MLISMFNRKMKPKGKIRHLVNIISGSIFAVIVIISFTFINKGFIKEDLSKARQSLGFPKQESASEDISINRQNVQSKKLTTILDDNIKFEAFDKDCEVKFEDTLDKNLKVIENYPAGQADLYMWKIGGNFTEPIRRGKNPVLATAASGKYFVQFMTLIKSFHFAVLNYRQKGERIKIIIYDIGMTRSQVNVVKNSGLPCEIRAFPFDEFPLHVKTLKYRAWKPILIQILLIEFGFVWWVDTSIRFKTLNVNKAFAEAKKYGLVFNIASGNTRHKITEQTSRDTFKYIEEDMCKFKQFSEADCSSVMVYFNNISRVIVNAWAKCALEKRCIAPTNTENVNKKECDSKEVHDGQCHRFEQSVFSILTRRIYHHQNVYTFNQVSDEIVVVNRSNVINTKKCKNHVCEI